MHSLWQDLSYGWRGIRSNPSFSALAVLTLALGIGAAATIFSVIHGVLLDPFPYTDASRVVTLQIRDLDSARPGGRSHFFTPEFLDYQEQSPVWEEVIAGANEDILYSAGEGTEQFPGARVSANTFRFLGVPPLLGRGLTAEDAAPSAPPVFVMAYKMWARQFGLDPSVLGRTYVLNGTPTTLVGIMPPRFTKMNADLWRPMNLSRADPEMARRMLMFQARLKRGVTMAQAETDVNAAAHRIAAVYPRQYPQRFKAELVPWIDSLVGQFRSTLYTMAAAVGLLLLIACGNVANMLLARAAAREKEMAVRISMGAGRWRIVRQLLIESLMLAAGGGALGCLLAYAGIQGLVTLLPEGMIPREAVIRINVPVLLFSLAVSMLTAILFGLAPALQLARPDVVAALKDSGKGVSGSFRRGVLRNALVVGEVALSLVLLTGAGLFLRSFAALQSVDLGLNPENVFVARVPLPRQQYGTPESRLRFFQTVIPRVQALPGVTQAAVVSSLPPFGALSSPVEIPGQPVPDHSETLFQLVSDGYPRTLGIKLTGGRFFTEAEVAGARKLAVVNQTFAAKHFGRENPVGRQVRIGALQSVFEVTGVIADAKNRGIQETPLPEVLLPYTVTGAYQRGLMARTTGDPAALANTIRREVWSVDRGVALTLAGPLTGYLKLFSYSEPRFSMLVMGLFACVGLVLVAIGVYSTVSQTVSRQTHEIGIRMALGAERGDVLGLVLKMGMQLIAGGALVGLAAALALGRLASTQFWGISPHDPLTLAAVIGVVVFAGAAACYWPARRASGVDPIKALRT
ncbi:MAG: ABC transporter permease [Acidobacteria bacterium]|nr:ABC transporter permease [Acidobacteriota bacterium]